MRALLGGWHAWVNSGGATERADAAARPGRQMKTPAPETHVIASPNPSIKEAESPDFAPGELKVTKVEAAAGTKQAPFKKKGKRARKRPKGR